MTKATMTLNLSEREMAGCALCAKLTPDIEQAAARTAAQAGGVMQCRECGRVYETSADRIAALEAEVERLTKDDGKTEAATVTKIVEWLRVQQHGRTSDNYPAYYARRIEDGEWKK